MFPPLGHFLWLQSLPSIPIYLVADGNGHLDPPLLSGFYMFFTMIILLQVKCVCVCRSVYVREREREREREEEKKVSVSSG